jgi:hypothetical protein
LVDVYIQKINRSNCMPAPMVTSASFLRKQESRAPIVLAVASDPRFRGGDEGDISSRAFRVHILKAPHSRIDYTVPTHCREDGDGGGEDWRVSLRRSAV